MCIGYGTEGRGYCDLFLNNSYFNSIKIKTMMKRTAFILKRAQEMNLEVSFPYFRNTYVCIMTFWPSFYVHRFDTRFDTIILFYRIKKTYRVHQ